MSQATHMYHNGIVITMGSGRISGTAVAVHGDRILAAGSLDSLSGLKNSRTKMIDLRGATMLPGLYDAHSHFLRAGWYDAFFVNLASPPAGTVGTMADIRARIGKQADATPPGEWIRCAYYDETALAEQRHFTLPELDAMAPGHPLFLRHVSGHIGLANSIALHMAGITSDTPDPPGGAIRRDAAGNPNGILEERSAMDAIQLLWDEPTPEEWKRAMVRATEMYTAKGVTTAQEGGVTDAMWDAYFACHREGILKNRVQLLPRFGHFTLAGLRETRSGAYLTPDGMLTQGAVKLFQDGSIQGYTASLTNPYHVLTDPSLPGGPFRRGYSTRSQADLDELVTMLHRQGRQVAVHGNGDQAIDEILNAFEGAQKAYPRADARHLIIHCQTVREDQLDRISRLGVVPSFFVVHTYYWGDRHRDIFLGPERAGRISPLQSALRRGIRFTNHNDTHVTPIDPMLSVWSAVNRRTSSGRVLGEEQRVDVVTALRGVTSWAAYQYCEEERKGSLEPGKLADMTVLAENPLTADPEKLRDIPVLATIVGNEIVYGSLP